MDEVDIQFAKHTFRTQYVFAEVRTVTNVLPLTSSVSFYVRFDILGSHYCIHANKNEPAPPKRGSHSLNAIACLSSFVDSLKTTE